MTSSHRLLVPLLIISAFLLPSLSHSEGHISNPVLDAKQAFKQGKIEFVGIQLPQQMLLPGVKPQQQYKIRHKYSIRPLNRRWKTLTNSEQDPRGLHQLKRYANRYNLTLQKLIKQERLEHVQRYRY